MKKLIYLIIAVSLAGCTLCVAQTIKHHSYTTYYDATLKEPDSVNWLLTPAMGSCASKLARLNKFIADPEVPNTNFNKFYAGSGFDQGHQFDADDASCNVTDEAECWYFTNMVPQKPNLNRITWRALENYCRKVASTQNVNITCGVTGTLGLIVGMEKVKGKVVQHPSTINIPAYCWKKLQYGKTVEYYIMPNVDSVSRHPFTFYKVK